MTAIEISKDNMMYGKVFAVYQQIGITLGVPIGGVVGLVSGGGGVGCTSEPPE